MAQTNLLFERQVLPALNSTIAWKTVLFFSDASIDNFSLLGLIKEREPHDREVDVFLECEGYSVRFHRYLNLVNKITKDGNVLYEYNEQKAFAERPMPLWLEIY